MSENAPIVSAEFLRPMVVEANTQPPKSDEEYAKEALERLVYRNTTVNPRWSKT